MFENMYTQEVWATYPSNPNYQVSNLSRIRRITGLRRKKSRDGILKQHKSSSTGYMFVILSQHGKTKYTTVHSMVLEAFIGRRPKGYVSNHRDGNRTNNKLWNLEYVTYGQNVRLGKLSKLTEVDVCRMRNAYKAGGVRQRVLAQEYGVTQQTVSQVVGGKTWKNI